MNTNTTLQSFTQSRRIRGVSMIELMVAMVIGLFMVLGATTLYVNSRKTADVDDAAARLQETARFAMDVLETDVRMANYWGLMKDGTSITNKAPASASLSPLISSSSSLNTCSNNFVFDTDNSIAADNNNYSFVDISGSCSPEPGNAVTSADTLTIRRVAAISSGSSSSSSSASSSSTVPATETLDPNLIQVCSTPQGASLITGGTTCPSVAQGNGAIYNLEVNAYYIDQQSAQSATLPSLRKKTLISGPSITDVEIAPGVEDMQVQFGWDSNDSGSAISYVNPGDAVLTSTTGQIVAVRIWLLIRAESPDASFTDSTTYEYADRAQGNGTTNNLNTATAATEAYVPNDHYRRILVSRTIFVRNALGT